MGNIVERFMTSSISRLYPERGWIPIVSSLGNQLLRKIESYQLDPRLLDVEYPNPSQLLRSTYAYARYESFSGLAVESKAYARVYFEECYFLNRADAEGYFYAIFFLRYLLDAMRITFRECRNYFRNIMQHDKSPLLTLRLCIEAFYSPPIDWTFKL